MRDGTEIKIKDMADSHLVNSLRMMRRNASSGIRLVQNAAMAVACGIQGEEASYQIEMDISSLEDFLEDPDEYLEKNAQYLALFREYKRRKLTADLGQVI